MTKPIEYSDGDGAPSNYEYVDEIEWDGESYQYNLTRIYRRRGDGTLWYADDNGCSCPSPFEYHTEEDLFPIRRLQDLYNHIATHEDSTAEPFVVDQINRVVWKVSEILNPEQRPFGAIKHAA